MSTAPSLHPLLIQSTFSLTQPLTSSAPTSKQMTPPFTIPSQTSPSLTSILGRPLRFPLSGTSFNEDEPPGRTGKRTRPRICWSHVSLSFHSFLVGFSGNNTKHKVEHVVFEFCSLWSSGKGMDLGVRWASECGSQLCLFQL